MWLFTYPFSLKVASSDQTVFDGRLIIMFAFDLYTVHAYGVRDVHAAPTTQAGDVVDMPCIQADVKPSSMRFLEHPGPDSNALHYLLSEFSNLQLDLLKPGVSATYTESIHVNTLKHTY